MPRPPPMLRNLRSKPWGREGGGEGGRRKWWACGRGALPCPPLPSCRCSGGPVRKRGGGASHAPAADTQAPFPPTHPPAHPAGPTSAAPHQCPHLRPDLLDEVHHQQRGVPEDVDLRGGRSSRRGGGSWSGAGLACAGLMAPGGVSGRRAGPTACGPRSHHACCGGGAQRGAGRPQAPAPAALGAEASSGSPPPEPPLAAPSSPPAPPSLAMVEHSQ